MDGTIIGQGTFIAPATVVNQNIQIPSGADWMKVINYTKSGVAGDTDAIGIEFYWQRGMAAGTGVVKYYANGGQALNGDTLVSGGFTLLDTSNTAPKARVATSASTNAVRPVVSTTNTAGVAVGTIVRMSNTAQTDVNGVDMVVGAVTANTNFTLLTASNPLATAPGAIGGAGFYRIIPFDPIFYPRHRFVCNVTQATNAQVSTTVAHGYTVGQELRFNIPSVSGMTELNGSQDNNFLPATVMSVVDDYNFTINIDTTAFTAFTWPTILQQPSSFPIVVPFGGDTATALAQVPPLSSLEDATVNTAFIGMTLGTGGDGAASAAPIAGPAGADPGDVMYWVAGKSTYGGL
jgi:hypothetical protein